MRALDESQELRTPAGAREFELSNADFQYLKSLVAQETGIKLADGKREMVYGRLARRLRQLQIDSFSDYCALLREPKSPELTHFINAITTNLTAFFREQHHFDYLSRTVVPLLLEGNAATRRIRIWSAGCSTGEEPYSIAMTLRESIPAIDRWDVKIVATDIDTNVLAKAANGVYADRDVENMARERLQRWFLRGSGGFAGKVRVKPELTRMIEFAQLNLMEQWGIESPFDVLFCRNVVIYFDKDTQRKLFARFADMLTPRAHLFIGHSESLFKVSEAFDLIGQTIYRKR